MLARVQHSSKLVGGVPLVFTFGHGAAKTMPSSEASRPFADLIRPQNQPGLAGARAGQSVVSRRFPKRPAVIGQATSGGDSKWRLHGCTLVTMLPPAYFKYRGSPTTFRRAPITGLQAITLCQCCPRHTACRQQPPRQP